MSSSKSSMSFKVQEFAAHGSTVNCLKIGRKSSGVLATGGEDKKVNVWAIGKMAPIQSLSGHQSPVECVNFDANEEVVVAGAANGTVKVWDLEHSRVIRSFTGHRSNALSTEFDSKGSLLATGSLDTNVKLWDLKQRSCIMTCKGHTKGVTHVRFSPDRKWVISGSQAGEIKVWDLAAGKCLQDLRHEGAITGMDFHPRELLLATSSADKTVKFWDLDAASLVDSTPPEATGVRAIVFHRDGDHVLSCLQDCMRVWQYEPAVAVDTVDISWSKIADVCIDKQRVVGCSFHQNMVGVWIIYLNQMKSFCTPDTYPLHDPAPRPLLAPPPPSHAQDIYPPPPGAVPPLPSTPEHPPRDHPSRVSRRWSQTNSAALLDAPPAATAPLSRPSPQTPRSLSLDRSNALPTADPPLRRPNRPVTSASRSDPPSPSPPPPSQSHSQPPSSHALSHPSHPPSSKPAMVSVGVAVGNSLGRDEAPPGHLRAQAVAAAAVERLSQPRRPRVSADGSVKDGRDAQQTGNRGGAGAGGSGAAGSFPKVEIYVPAGMGPATGQGQERGGAGGDSGGFYGGRGRGGEGTGRQQEDAGTSTQQQMYTGRVRSPHLPSPDPSYLVPQLPAPAYPAHAPNPSPPSPRYRRTRSPSPTSHHRPPSPPAHHSHNAAPPAWLPPPPASAPSYTSSYPSAAAAPAPPTDLAVIASINAKHSPTLALLQRRHNTVSLCANFWRRRDVRGMLSALRRAADPTATYDVLSCMLNHHEPFTLDTLADLLPLIDALLCSQSDHHVGRGLDLLALLLRHFGDMIRETCAHHAHVGVDVKFEERREKCAVARGALQGLGGTLGRVAKHVELHSRRADSLAAQVAAL